MKIIESEEESEAPRIETRDCSRYLKCILTDEEKHIIASELVQRMEERKRKEDELKSIQSQFKGELSRLDAEIDAKAGLVRDGYQFRDVTVLETKNFDTESFTLTRIDTGEVIEDRRLTPTEMQRNLPGFQ